jgi:multidrug efflux pump subunit AcrA (membrane-fusion protein)
MPFFSQSRIKRLVMIVPIIIAIMITAYLIKHRKIPEQNENKINSVSVRFVNTKFVPVIPRAIGNGYVTPEKAWQAVSQVSGKVIQMNPLLKKGAFIRKETVLLKIDPTAYELAIAQMESVIEQNKAQLTALKVEEKNIRASLEIEKQSLALSKKELNRQESLYKKGRISASKYDQEKLAYFRQVAKVQNLKNSHNILPSNQKSLKAQLAMNRSKLEDAQLNLSYTIIKAPFDCRIIQVNAEIAQFIQKGQVIVKADGTDAVEIPVQIPVGKMRRLLTSVDKNIQPMQMDFREWKKVLGLHALVRFHLGHNFVQWTADVDRIDASIDPQTRTIGLMVVVEKPYDKIRLGERPPLIRNMFCEVEIIGQPIPQCIIVPRIAIHKNILYTVTKELTLKKMHVLPDFFQGDFCVIRKGIDENISIIVSDLTPAIDGMAVTPILDEQISQDLMNEASGSNDN